MRILAIRGENLASLGAPFALELEHEPLRSAGLFAIAGETGAGKSTLLDALCLALYDTYPRVDAPGANEKIPDSSGDPIGGGDPRAMLRRGAGRGYAEADFVARDGLRYRARCDLARARGKASGKLQNRGRSLFRIDDAGEIVAAVESGVEPVNKRIIDLTDLTFDQFRRTVLLAQGDFDAFLRAEERERAELLEKITGAEIYGVLSRRAYEIASGERDRLNALEARRADIGVLSEMDRAAMDAQFADADAARAARAIEHAALREELRLHDALAKARAKLTEAEAAREQARDALAGVAPQRKMLDHVVRVEPLRAPRDAMRRAETAHENAMREADEAQDRAKDAQAKMHSAFENDRAASHALDAIDHDMQELGPIWARATELDIRIATAAREADKSQALAESAARAAQARFDAHLAAQSRRSAVSVALDAAAQALQRVAPARPLFERWEEIEDSLAKREAFAKARMESAASLRSVKTEFQRAERRLAALYEEDKKDRSALDSLAAQIERRGAALAALDETAAGARAEDLRATVETAQTLARLMRDNAAARVAHAQAQADADKFAQAIEALEQRAISLKETRGLRAAELEKASRLGELADAVADADSLRLRAALEDGEPCPVCGGRDHPFAHAQDAARDLVETLRAERDAARRRLTELDDAISALGAEAAQARARRAAAADRCGEAETTLQRLSGEFGSAQAQHSLRMQEFAFTIDSEPAQLERICAQLNAERDAIQTKLDAARRLREELEALRRQRDGKAAAMEARRSDREEANATLQSAGESRARLEVESAGRQERIESIDRELSPFLAACALSGADLERDAASARRRLKTVAAEFDEARRRVVEFETEKASLDLRLATLAAELESETRNETDAAERVRANQQELETLRAERARLLDGEATAAHRGRFEEKRRAAAQTQERARRALSDSRSAAAAAAERVSIAQDSLAAAERARATAAETFRAALAASGDDAQTAESLLDIDPGSLAAVRQAVEAARHGLAAAQAAVAARQADLEEALEAINSPEDSRDAIAAREAALAQELDELSRRLGELRASIDQDDRLGAQARALSSEIEDARAVQALWREIDDAIGSKSGDKFRRFAQSVTLEQLVALANQRLALLAPRYRLERSGEMGSLGLQIVDRDLGDERRSPRSLSGGERFLASLALALALAGLEGRDSFVDTLFIDEGFGALDAATLDVAIDALENLQGQGRKVGVISHVESLQQRIACKVCVERRGGGLSVVRIVAPGFVE